MIKSYIRRPDATRNHGASDLDQSIIGEEGKSVLSNPLDFCKKSQTQTKLTVTDSINQFLKTKKPNKSPGHDKNQDNFEIFILIIMSIIFSQNADFQIKSS
jgi:hypothetical protein